MIHMSLGARIAQLRKQQGLTQDELAEVMQVSPQAVSKWENDLSCPDIQLLPKLADFLHVSIDELLRGKREAQLQVMPEGTRDLNKTLLKVFVLSEEGDKVKVNLPVSLIKMALDIGLQLPEVSGNKVLENIDFDAILQMAEKGVIGKLVDIESADGDLVEIYIE